MSETATVRSVTVRLNAEIAKYVADVRTAGRETDKAFAGVNDRLSTTDDRLGKVSTGFDRVAASERKVTSETSRVDTTASRMNRTIDGSGRSIDKYSGRLGLLVSALTSVGPAAVPIVAVAIPAVTALASGIGFAAAGAGTFVLAMHGVKDALTKVNKAAIEPTDANLLAAHLAMAQLPPDARAFVRELQRMRPEISRLQAAAGSGLFPGLTSGLHSIQTDGPLVERALHNIGGELGHLAKDAGRSLSSDQWRPFLRFVGTEAPRELGVLGHASGDVAHGLAELWMALNPLNRGVDAGILRLAQDFDRWATSLGKTKDFESFIQYIQTNGPRVITLLGDVGQLFIDIVKAAAPLGGPTVQALDLIVKLLDAIAKSPLGTPLLLLAQMNAVLKLTGRGLGALGVDAKLGLGGVSTGARGGSASLKALRADAVSAGKALKTMGGNVNRNAAPFGSPLTAGVDKEGLNNLAKGTALAGGMTLAVSGLDNSMGLTNTTSLALAGSLAGPLGAGIGGAIGLSLDWQASLERDRVSAEAFGAEIDRLASTDKVAALQHLSTQFHALQDQSGGGLVGDIAAKGLAKIDPALAKTKARTDELRGSQKLAARAAGDFGDAQQAAAQQTIAARTAAHTTATQFVGLGKSLDDSKTSLDGWIRELAAQARALTEFGSNAREAGNKGLRDGLIKQLEAAGPAGALRMKQLANASQTEIAKANQAWAAGQRAIQKYSNQIGSVPAAHLQVDTSQAMTNLRVLQYQIDHLHGNSVVVRAIGGHTTIGPGQAAGGTVPGRRTPYGDKVLSMLAPGEEVITNRHGEADRYRSDRAAGRIPAYAAGGTVTTSTRTTAGLFAQSPELAHEMTGVRGHLHQLSISLAAATKVLDAERQARQTLVSNEKQLISTVRDQFRTDLFASQGSVWDQGGGFNPLATLQGDIHDSRQFRRLLQGLHRRGLGGGLLAQLAQSGSIVDAQQLAGMSGGQLSDLEHAFKTRQRLSQDVGQYAGVAVFGDRIAEQTAVVRQELAEVRHLRREVHQSNQELAAIRKHAAANPQNTAKALDKGAGNATRKVPRT